MTVVGVYKGPLPPVDDVSAAWWEGTKRKELLIQVCRCCGASQYYPRALCTACGGTDLGFMAVDGAGRLHSFTVVHRQPFEWADPPYVLALVQLAEGPTILTHLVDCPPSRVRCDLAVRLCWLEVTDGRHLPVFRAMVIGEGEAQDS